LADKIGAVLLALGKLAVGSLYQAEKADKNIPTTTGFFPVGMHAMINSTKTRYLFFHFIHKLVLKINLSIYLFSIISLLHFIFFKRDINV
jgi:hypothetical protein